MNRLRSFFERQIVDLGGFNNMDFTAHLLKADEVVLVADQSVGAIVSAAELLQELKKREVETNGIHLVISNTTRGWASMPGNCRAAGAALRPHCSRPAQR